MQIEYRNTLPDIIRFNLYHFPRTMSFRIVFTLILLLFAKDVNALDLPVATKVLVFVTLALGLYLFFVVSIGLLSTLNYLPGKNKGIFTRHRVTLTDDGVEEETDVGVSTNRWSSVPRVAQNRSYILLYVQQNMAHVIPKRSFRDSAHAREFFDRASALKNAASSAA